MSEAKWQAENLELAKQLIAWSRAEQIGVSGDDLVAAKELARKMLSAVANTTCSQTAEAAWLLCCHRGPERDGKTASDWLVIAAVHGHEDAKREVEESDDADLKARFTRASRRFEFDGD